MKSTDGGSVWTVSDEEYYNYGGDLVSAPNDDGIFWSGGNHNIASHVEVMAVSKTTDVGETWARYELTDTIGMTEALVVDPSNSNIVYAGGYADNNPALYKTTDGGENWSDVSSGLSGYVKALAINPDNTDIVYAGTGDGVFKSTNSGANWTGSGLTNVNDLLIDPNATNMIYAATDSGVYISITGGGDWQELNEGLDTTLVFCLGIHPDTYIFVGTYCAGVYRLIPNFDPPAAPYIAYLEKTGVDSIDAKLIWNQVSTDTTGNPEDMGYYVVYRDSTPLFVPETSDSIAAVAHPETTYIDSGALNAAENYYYLVKAVDSAKNRSKKSNMGYVLDRFFNYNTDRSSRNWVSLPWHSGYNTVSDLVADLSPAGDPLESVTNLRDDMVEETWLYDTDFMMWYGPNDFAIAPGRAYEMVPIKDTTLVLVGSNDPNGLISLNHNTDRSSRNWVSIPFNADYSTVDDIAQEYSPAGDPLESITNLRDDMVQETWLYDTDFMLWYGPNDFAIEPGKGYEFVPIKDTTWNPNEYSNEAFALMLASRGVRRSDIEVYAGQSLEPDRSPVWTVKESAKRIDNSDAKAYTLNTRRLDEKADYREPGISHIVRVHLSLKEFDNLVFTAYRPEQPNDVLTENMSGSCVAIKGDQAAFFFNVANFKRPWQDEEEVILIIEATKQGRGYFTVANVFLNERVDVQDVDNITLTPISEPVFKKDLVRWHGIDNDNIVGYSIYKYDERLNEKVLKRRNYAAAGDVNIRPVIRGGYETIYGSQGPQSRPKTHIPISYAFNIYPNPFVTQIRIDYALPTHTSVAIAIYDATGRQVKTLISEMQKPGYYSTIWHGADDIGRKVSSGIYFIRFEAGEFRAQDKILLIK